MSITTITASAPSHWASYFINGDSSGMDNAEIIAADAFAEWCGGDIVDCGEEYFSWHCDARYVCPVDWQGATVCDYVIICR